MGKTEQVRTDLVTTGADKAAADIDKVADAAERLEKSDPTVEVDADTRPAQRELDDVADKADKLTRADHVLALKATADAARAELRALEDQVKQTGDAAQVANRQLDDVTSAGGTGVRGNAISDLTGPLGEASSAASDFAGFVDGADDLLGDLFSRMGASDQFIGKMSSALGVLGVGVAAGAAAWGLFKQRQEEAARQQKEMIDKTRELNEAIKEGNRTAATTAFRDLFKEQEVAARNAGVPVKEWIDYVRGARDTLPSLDARMKEHLATLEAQTTGFGNSSQAVERQRQQYEGWLGVLEAGRQQYIANNGTVAEATALDNAYADALIRTETNTRKVGDAAADTEVSVERLGEQFDTLRGKVDFEQANLRFRTSFEEAAQKVRDGIGLTEQDIIDLKLNYLQVAEDIGQNPVEVRSNLKQIESGNVADVLWYTQSQVNSRPPIDIKAKLRLEQSAIVVTGAGMGSMTIPGQGMVVPQAAAPVINVTQHLPRGWRGDALGEVRAVARRSGGYYRRARR